MTENRATIKVVGIGPGATEMITPTALAAIESVDVIIGYTTYLRLIKDLAPDTPRHSTKMRQGGAAGQSSGGFGHRR